MIIIKRNIPYLIKQKLQQNAEEKQYSPATRGVWAQEDDDLYKSKKLWQFSS